MAQQLRPSKPADKQSKIDWSRRQEAENFAETVKLFRQGKIDPDMFRRFRLQHGAYGTRMTDDYAMVRIKVPAGQVYPNQLEKIKFNMYRSDLKLFNGFLFTDFKYLMAYSIPLTALIGVYLGGYWLFLTPVYIFVLIPITEFILTSFGVDELEKQRSEKVIHWIFDTMLYLNIPIVFGLLFL